MTTKAAAGFGSAYWRLLSSSTVSAMGDGIRFTALPLLSVALLADPFQVALVTAATTVPWLVLGLPVGAYADRADRVRMMIGADLFRAAGLLVAVVLLVTGHLTFVPLLLLALVLGIGEVVFDCASFAVLPSVVPAERLEAANGRLFTSQTVSRDMLGHLAGGLLFTLGRAVPLVVDAVSFVVSALLLRKLPRQAPRPAEERDLWREILDGARYIVRDRLLATLTAAAGVINAVYLGQVAVFVLFVTDVLGLGPTGYSLLLAGGALGGVVGGLAAEHLVRRFGRRTALVGGLVLVGGAGAGVVAGTVVTTALGYFAMGFGLMVWNVVAVSLRQVIVPERLLGRTIGAYRVVAWGTMPLGAAAFGALAQVWGSRWAFGVGAVAILVLAVPVALVLAGDVRLTVQGKDHRGDE
ncbi:MFS transporter [Lentzea sp. JNUCC 0626]|uniref:MFS transporter n=1 Tax=Lentzea sp. JNUCC 0626 TaxID=3367513 RepID=UPI00374A7D2A